MGLGVSNNAGKFYGIAQQTADHGAGEPNGTYGVQDFVTPGTGTSGTGFPQYTGSITDWAIGILVVNIQTGNISSVVMPLLKVATPTAYAGFQSNLAEAITTPVNFMTLTGTFNNQSVDFAEVLLYGNAIGNEQAIINYFWNKYNNIFPVPLTFPANSTPQLNNI